MLKIEEIPKKEIALIRELWEQLNKLHEKDSTYFKDHFKNFTFEKRCEAFADVPDENFKILIARENSKIVGYCISSVKNFTGEIESIMIDNKYQKKGTGRAFIVKSKEWFRTKKCSKVIVSVASGHDDVYKFYEKMGFYPRLICFELKDTAVTGN